MTLRRNTTPARHKTRTPMAKCGKREAFLMSTKSQTDFVYDCMQPVLTSVADLPWLPASLYGLLQIFRLLERLFIKMHANLGLFIILFLTSTSFSPNMKFLYGVVANLDTSNNSISSKEVAA